MQTSNVIPLSKPSPLIVSHHRVQNVIRCSYDNGTPSIKDRHPIDEFLTFYLHPDPTITTVSCIEITSFSNLVSTLRGARDIHMNQPLPLGHVIRKMIVLTGGLSTPPKRFAYNLALRLVDTLELDARTVNSLLEQFTIPSRLL